MRRWTIRIVVFLLFGAIVNVAVAWGCAFSAQWSTPGRLRTINDKELTWLDGRGEKPASLVTENEGNGVSLWMCDLADATWDSDPATRAKPSRPFQVIVYSAGFPFLSLTGEVWFHSRDWARANQQSVLINKPPDMEGIWDRGSALLPYIPIWPGFAINTVFYAAIMWLLFAGPFVVRRWRRIRRGLCPQCAYDLRGTPPGVACPECGAGVNRSASSSQ